MKTIKLVGSGGLEPPHAKISDFESLVSTIPPQGHFLEFTNSFSF